MLAEKKPTAPAVSPRYLVFLLALALLISYVDRGNLATAAPLIKSELGLDEAQYGLLASAFYWTYVAFMVPVGWATERFAYSSTNSRTISRNSFFSWKLKARSSKRRTPSNS